MSVYEQKYQGPFQLNDSCAIIEETMKNTSKHDVTTAQTNFNNICFSLRILELHGEGECQAQSRSAVGLLVVFIARRSTRVSEHTSDKTLNLRRKGKVRPVTCHGGTDGE